MPIETIGWTKSVIDVAAGSVVRINDVHGYNGLYTISATLTLCPYCGGSTLACCEHSSDSAEELNKRVREGAD